MRHRSKSVGRMFLALFLPLVLIASGCPKGKTDVYTAAVTGANDYAATVNGVIQVGQSLYAAQLIDQQEYRTILQASAELNIYGQTFLATVNKIHQDPSAGTVRYLDAANIAVQQAQLLNVNAALHVKNPAAQAKLTVALEAVSVLLSGISLRITNALPNTPITQVPPAPPAQVARPVVPPTPAPAPPTPSTEPPATSTPGGN